MSSAFAEKKGKVVAVDSSSSARQLMTEVLKGIGFQDVTGLGSVKDAVGMLEVEPIEWLILPIDKGTEVNALQILKIITQYPQIRRTRVSLLLEEAEKSVLGFAYSHGLLSHHEKPFTKDSLTSGLTTLMKRLEANTWDSCLTSAEYLREWLKTSKLPDVWLNFEKSMIELYPGNTNLLVKMAEPQFQNNLKEQAKTSLRQARMMDETLATEIKTLMDTYCPGEELKVAAGENEAPINVLGVERCVVVDPDNAIQKVVKQVLNEVGLNDVQCFDDGEAAIDYLKKNPEPGLVIQEWRIPKIAGPLFLQMMRKAGTVSSPIVVLSSLLQQDDFPLVREMGVASIVQKPFDRASFLKSVIWTIQQDKTPTDQHALERKIREMLAAKKTAKAAELKSQYLAAPNIPDGKKRLIEAEFAYANADYPAAKNFGFEALKLGAESILILNILGKTLMKLRDFDSGLRCFEKAQTLSPLNVERLCKIAEVHTELGNDQQADAALAAAKNIDENNKDVKETEAKIALSKGDTESAKKLMSQLDSLDELISYMNNKAVALARSGDVDGGIAQYRKTLASVPDDRESVRGAVLYNTGLAYARAGDLEEAKLNLEKCIKLQSNAKRKAESLKKRVAKAIETGEPLQLRSDDPTGEKNADLQLPEQEELGSKTVAAATAGTDATGKPTSPTPIALEKGSQNRDVAAAVQVAKKDLCCFMVFNDNRELSPDIKTMIATLPRFNPRAAIAREASFGAEKTLKAS